MIIGISGKIGAGKDTLAQMITELDPDWQLTGFAHNVKLVCAVITGVPFAEQLSREGKSQLIPGGWGFTVGQMQQHIGTTLRLIDQDIWVKSLLMDYRPIDKWIIADMRFPNEARAIKERGGFLVRINGSRTGPQGRNPNHISEIALDNWVEWDYIFDNSGIGLDKLRAHADQILLEVSRDVVVHV